MKFFMLGLFALITSGETFAQVRGPRYNPPGGGRHDRYGSRPGPGRNDRHDRNDRYDRNDHHRGGTTVIISPRYTSRRDSRRIIRSYRRSPIIWSTGFGYTCGAYGDLRLNGMNIHNFRFSSDCYTALTDIRLYGDFCDQEDLYDQSGIMEAQFNYNYECREALGYYY